MSQKTGELIQLIDMWADDVGIYREGSVEKQAEKMNEENGEFQRAVGSGNRADMIDELGDWFVTGVVQAGLLEVGVEEVLYLVYQKLVSRMKNGKMVNGTFKKEEDL